MNTIQSNNPINTAGLCACPLWAYNYSSLTPSFYSAAQLDHWDKYLRPNGVKKCKSYSTWCWIHPSEVSRPPTGDEKLSLLSGPSRNYVFKGSPVGILTCFGGVLRRDMTQVNKEKLLDNVVLYMTCFSCSHPDTVHYYCLNKAVIIETAFDSHAFSFYAKEHLWQFDNSFCARRFSDMQVGRWQN